MRRQIRNNMGDKMGAHKRDQIRDKREMDGVIWRIRWIYMGYQMGIK